MPERLDIVSLTVGYAVILVALGSGPTVLWARGFGSRLVISPAVGFALAAILLSTSSPVLTARQAAWVILIPASLLSVAAAVLLLRRESRTLPRRDSLVPLALAIIAVGIAVGPEIARNTAGPISLKVFDAWVYIESDQWLAGHTLGDGAPVSSVADLIATTGYAFTHAEEVGLSRIGLAGINGSVAEVLRSAPDRTHVPMLALLFAMIPMGVWAAARGLGAGRRAASFGAVFGLSAVPLVLVADSALGNLTALALVPVTLALLARGLVSGDSRAVLLAAVLTAGLLCCYPEFAVPLLLVIGFECTVGVGWLAFRDRTKIGTAVRRIALAAAILAGAAIVLAPVGVLRAFVVLRQQLGNADAGALPARPITIVDGPAWAFGLLHLYQLPRFDLLSTTKTIAVLIVPVILVVIILLGVPRLGALTSLLCFGPIVVGLLVAAASYSQRQDCSYCLWKALTFVGPFLGIAVALGITGLAAWRVPSNLARGVVVAFGIGVSSMVLYTDVKVVLALYHSEAVYRPGLRTLTEALRDETRTSPVLLEGMDATAAPKFTLPAAYYAMAVVPDTRIVFAPSGDAGLYLLVQGPPDDYYTPDYGLVATGFPGLDTGRRRVVGAGPFALDRRAPIDVSPADTGWSFDPAEGQRSIPWVTRPFDLRVAGNRDQVFSVTVHLRPSPENLRADLGLTLDGVALDDRSPDPRIVCVEIPRIAGELTIKATPTIPRPTPFRSPATESDPVPPPPKDLGLEAVRAQPGECEAPA